MKRAIILFIEYINLSNDLNVNTSKKISKLDENSAAFILQGFIDFLKKQVDLITQKAYRVDFNGNSK